MILFSLEKVVQDLRSNQQEVFLMTENSFSIFTYKVYNQFDFDDVYV